MLTQCIHNNMFILETHNSKKHVCNHTLRTHYVIKHSSIMTLHHDDHVQKQTGRRDYYLCWKGRARLLETQRNHHLVNTECTTLHTCLLYISSNPNKHRIDV